MAGVCWQCLSTQRHSHWCCFCHLVRACPLLLLHVFLQHFGDHMPRGAYLQFYWNDSPVNDGNYIHPIPLQMLVAGKGGPSMLHGAVRHLHWFVLLKQ
jgi:hypothetical protein